MAIGERRGRLVVQLEDEVVLYTDVATDAWYTPYVADLAISGIAQGYRDEQGNLTNTFGVANPVTKAEMLKMALEATGASPDSTLKLAPANRSARGTWAALYVKLAEDAGFAVFAENPDVHTPATRAEVVQTLLEALDLPLAKTPSTFSDVPATHPYSRAIGLAAYYGFIGGDTDAQGTPLNTFRPDVYINRAEVAKMIAVAREVME